MPEKRKPVLYNCFLPVQLWIIGLDNTALHLSREYEFHRFVCNYHFPQFCPSRQGKPSSGMFLFQHHLIPSSFLNLFATNNLIHSHNTTRATDYHPHVCRTNVKSFMNWNSLPKNVTSSETLSCFKKKLFHFLDQ